MAEATFDKPTHEITSFDNTGSASEPAAIAEPHPRKLPIGDNDPTRNVSPAKSAGSLGAVLAALLVLALMIAATVAMVAR